MESMAPGVAADSALPAPRTHWREWGPTSAAGLVLREFTWVALASQAVWLLASPELWPGRVTTPTASAAVVASIGTWAILLAAQWRGTTLQRRVVRYADVAVVGLAAVVLGLSADSSAGWDAAASMTILCGGLAGALLPARVSLPTLLVLVLLSVEPSMRFADSATGDATTRVALFVTVVGGCVAGVRSVLYRNARRIDADTRTRDEIERQRRTVEGVEAALLRQERLLHETVLNTLTAIDRGGLGSSTTVAGALQQRCAEAVDVLTGLESGAQALGPDVTVSPTGFVSLGNDLVSFIDGLRHQGIAVDVVIDSLEDVPERVRGALGTAIRESLANVARHAGARHAWVLLRVRRSSALSLRVEVRDDGQGFDTSTAARRFGLDQAIRGPMEEVGGDARIDSVAGVGTKVVLDWEEPPNDALDRFWAARPGFALPAMATFGLFLAATAALAWLQFNHPAISAVDVALVVVLGVLISLATPEAPLPWGPVLAFSTLGPLFALLTVTADAPSPYASGWVLAAIAALFTTAGAIGPRLGWIPLTASWLLVEGDPLGSLVEPATLLVVGGAFFGRSLRRDTVAMERAHEARLRAATALDVTRESLARLRSRYGPLEGARAIALLRGIIDGDLDPDDPKVRRAAAVEESFIRNLMRIDPQTDALRALAAELAVVAHQRDVLLTCDLSLPAMPGVVVEPAHAGSLAAAVEHTEQYGAARLTVRVEGSDVVVSLVAPIADGERDRMQALPLAGMVTDPGDPQDPMMLWEARLRGGEPA